MIGLGRGILTGFLLSPRCQNREGEGGAEEEAEGAEEEERTGL